MSAWQDDRVSTADGTVVPVRKTARRPVWADLPESVRVFIEELVGGAVVDAWSAGTGFTPGFASRLTLADGQRVFVKAASSADDRLYDFKLSDDYRDEAQKLRLMPDGVGAPELLASADTLLADEQWVVLVFAHINGEPPRRPWRPQQLSLVLSQLTQMTTRLTPAPGGFDWVTVEDELVGTLDERLSVVLAEDGASPWLSTITELSAQAPELICGDSLVHMDFRDDNILIDATGAVWVVDWNWPVVGAPWVDLVCLLLSAHGDGIDTDAILASHPLSRDAAPHAINALLAILWSFWAVAVSQPAPASSPHLRDHQRWYLETTRAWLAARLAAP